VKKKIKWMPEAIFGDQKQQATQSKAQGMRPES
jgi:hypothetical protein